MSTRENGGGAPRGPSRGDRPQRSSKQSVGEDSVVARTRAAAVLHRYKAFDEPITEDDLSDPEFVQGDLLHAMLQQSYAQSLLLETVVQSLVKMQAELTSVTEHSARTSNGVIAALSRLKRLGEVVSQMADIMSQPPDEGEDDEDRDEDDDEDHSEDDDDDFDDEGVGQADGPPAPPSRGVVPDAVIPPTATTTDGARFPDHPEV